MERIEKDIKDNLYYSEFQNGKHMRNILCETFGHSIK